MRFDGFRAARRSPTGSLRRSRVGRTRSAPRGRSARATGSASSCPATEWSPPRDRLVRLPRGRVQAPPIGARGCLSEDLRNELAAIAPRRDCDRLAELSGLFHSAGSLHLRGRGEVALHFDLGSPAAARRTFSLLRELGVTSEIRTYQRHAFGRETRYQLHVAGETGRFRCCTRRAWSAPVWRRSSGRRSALSAARAVAARTSAGPCSEAGACQGRARRTSRFGARPGRVRSSSPRSRGLPELSSASSTGGGIRWRTRKGWARSLMCLRLRARATR